MRHWQCVDQLTQKSELGYVGSACHVSGSGVAEREDYDASALGDARIRTCIDVVVGHERLREEAEVVLQQ